MQWLGDFCQREISSTDTVLDLMCGDCIPVIGLNCKSYLGVDLFSSWAEKAKDKMSVIRADVRQTRNLFFDKSFDAVLCLDGLEHLIQNEMEELVVDMIRIARKRIFIFTPVIFQKQNELGNPYNQHHCLVTEEFLHKYNFETTRNTPTANIFGIWRAK